jgi:excisionase family DNA binding protein
MRERSRVVKHMTTLARLVRRREEGLPKSADVANDDALLGVEDVAEILKVPPSWVYEHTRKRTVDRIPGFRLGKYWRFRRSDVLAWLERQKVGTRANA